MGNEEIQRTMEFILQQQAQFAANIQRLQEERFDDNSRFVRLEESFELLVRLAENSDSRLDLANTRVDRLESILENNLTTLGTRMQALAESQLHTDQRLNALIDIVREDRNGRL